MKNILARVVLAGLCALAGCSSTESNTSPRDDASTAASPDAPPADVPPDLTRPDLAEVIPDAVPPPDFAPPPTALPLPAGVNPPQRFLGRDDHLAGDGSTACSDPDPSSSAAERWCVFYRSAPSAPVAELWIVNVTKAAAGAVPRCDGSSPDCVRLTSTLWTGTLLGGPFHPFSHQFNGETLIFYADSPRGPKEPYQGPVYGWRPGWGQPRALTSPKGVMCFGHPHKPLVHCVDSVAGDPMKPESFELRAGSVAETPAGPLPSLGRFRPFRTDGAVAWEASFSPDGQVFAISSADPDPAVETLKVVPTRDLGVQPLKEMLRDATNWTVGNDGRRLYFVRPDGTNDTSALFAADFPGGGGEVKLSDAVRDYLVPGEGDADQGVSFLVSLGADRHAFRFLGDSRVPDGVFDVFTYRGLLEDVHMSSDLRYTAWLDEGFNARVVRHADLSSCRLNIYSDGAAFEPLFLANSGLVFWSEYIPGADNRHDAFLGRPDDCEVKQRFAMGITLYTPLGDRALVYTDESNERSEATLKYATVRQNSDGWTLDTPVRVHEGLEEGSFTLVGTPPVLILFRTGGADGGTWVFGPLPF